MRGSFWLAGALAATLAAVALASSNSGTIAALLDKGQAQQAFDAATAELKLNADDAAVRFYQALAAARLGKTKEAIAGFEKLAKLWPESPAVHNNLAVLYARQGDYDRARSEFEAALATDGRYQTAYKNLTDLFAAQAAEAYNKALARDEQRSLPKPDLAMLTQPDTALQPATEQARVAKAQPQATQPARPAAMPEPVVPASPPAQASKHEAPAMAEPVSSSTAAAPPVTKPVAVASLAVHAQADTAPTQEAEPAPPPPSPPPAAKVAANEPPPATTPPAARPEQASSPAMAAEVGPPPQELVTREHDPEPPPAPTVTATAPAPAKPVDQLPDVHAQAASVERAVTGWAAAWSDQNVQGYLAAYEKGYRPAGEKLSHAAWQKQRRERISVPKFIRVKLSNIEVRLLDATHAQAQFRQSYESDSFSDNVVKRLQLVKAGKAWKISSESIIGH